MTLALAGCAQAAEPEANWNDPRPMLQASLTKIPRSSDGKFTIPDVRVCSGGARGGLQFV